MPSFSMKAQSDLQQKKKKINYKIGERAEQDNLKTKHPFVKINQVPKHHAVMSRRT